MYNNSIFRENITIFPLNFWMHAVIQKVFSIYRVKAIILKSYNLVIFFKLFKPIYTVLPKVDIN